MSGPGSATTPRDMAFLDEAPVADQSAVGTCSLTEWSLATRLNFQSFPETELSYFVFYRIANFLVELRFPSQSAFRNLL